VHISEKSATDTLAMIRQALGKKAFTVHRKSKLNETEIDETGEEKSQDYAHHFL
jgi:hypothetical protein